MLGPAYPSGTTLPNNKKEYRVASYLKRGTTISIPPEDAFRFDDKDGVHWGYVRSKVFNAAKEDAMYSEGEHSLVGQRSELFIQLCYNKPQVEKVSNTEEFWTHVENRITNKSRKEAAREVEIRMAVGRKKKEDAEWVLDQHDAEQEEHVLLSQSSTLQLHSPAATKKKPTNRDRRAAVVDRVNGFRPFLERAVKTPGHELHLALTKEMITFIVDFYSHNRVAGTDDYCDEFWDFETNELDKFPKLDEMPKIGNEFGGRKPGTGKYPLDDDGQIPSYPLGSNSKDTTDDPLAHAMQKQTDAMLSFAQTFVEGKKENTVVFHVFREQHTLYKLAKCATQVMIENVQDKGTTLESVIDAIKAKNDKSEKAVIRIPQKLKNDIEDEMVRIKGRIRSDDDRTLVDVSRTDFKLSKLAAVLDIVPNTLRPIPFELYVAPIDVTGGDSDDEGDDF